MVFDELGLCYGAELRAGNTKSGTDAVGLITNALSPYSFRDEKHTHADSAYCHQEYIECQVRLGAKFTLTANDATTGWSSHIDEITDWEGWKFEKEYTEEAAKRGQTLPFAKRFRTQFIHRPGRLVNHSGRTDLKVSRSFFEEVTRLRKAWRLEPRPALGIGAAYSTA